MGDLGLDAIFAALTNADKQSREDSPFNPFEALATDVGQSIYKDAPHYSTAENLIGGLLTGLVGGGSKQLTNRYVADQDAIARDIIIGSMTGNRIDRPSSMSPSIYSTLDNAGSIYTLGEKLNSASAAAEDQRKFQQAAELQRLKSIGEKPYQAGMINSAYGVDAGQPAQAEPMVKNSGPSLQDYMNQAQGDESTAKMLMQRDLEKPDRLTVLRKEFSALPEVKDFIAADTGFKSMQQAFKDPSGTSDIELTRAAIQAIEPGLAVRMDDQQAIAASPSFADSWKAQMSGALNGTSRLSADVRDGLMRIAQRRYNEYAGKFNTARTFYQNQAAASQLDPSGISYLNEATPNKDTFASGLISTPDGKRWQQQGDKYIEVP